MLRSALLRGSPKSRVVRSDFAVKHIAAVTGTGPRGLEVSNLVGLVVEFYILA